MENALIVFEQEIPDQQGTKGEFEPRKPVPLNIKGRPPVSVQAKDPSRSQCPTNGN
jgi:hypothetical protein